MIKMKGLKVLAVSLMAGVLAFGIKFNSNATPADIDLNSDKDIDCSYIREDLEVYDTNKDGYLSDEENKKVISFEVFGRYTIVDPRGLDKLIYLKKLDLNGGSTTYEEGTIAKLDFTAFKDLEEFDCSSSGLQELNLSGLSSLKTLDCTHNGISKFNFTGCTSLTKIDAHSAISYENKDFIIPSHVPLKEINIEYCHFDKFYIEPGVPIEKLECSDCQGKIIDVSNCENLKSINGDYGEITEIKVNKNIEYLDVAENKIKKLDLSGCSSLEEALCFSNKITSLNVNGCTSLKTLNCADNKLTGLNVKGCTNLTILNCDSNKLKSIDVSSNKKLDELSCDNNSISNLKLGKIKKLITIHCSNNKLTSLNLKYCTKLSRLECDHNKLKKLNISKNKKLNILNCSFNNLKSLKVSGNKKLWIMYAYGNNIKKINVTGLKKTLEYDGRYDGFYNEASQKKLTKLVKENGKKYITYSAKKKYVKLYKHRMTGDEDS
ncbi:MAG: hypothetical protein K6F55_02715 [Eubacterium sp.]|nr:hypothetical protein [Eubacterium sp.]